MLRWRLRLACCSGRSGSGCCCGAPRVVDSGKVGHSAGPEAAPSEVWLPLLLNGGTSALLRLCLARFGGWVALQQASARGGRGLGTAQAAAGAGHSARHAHVGQALR